MKRWFQRWFSFLGMLVTAMLLMAIVLGAWQCATKDRVPDGTVLELRLDRPLLDYVAKDSLLALVQSDVATVHEIVEGLERAGRDDRVHGLIAHVGGSTHGMARTQELRDAISRFRATGKFAIAFAETFGEFGPGNEGYYLATAFDEIWLQPSGDLGLTGLMSEGVFIKGALEKLDVEFLGDHRKEYKNALNLFTERHFTPPHREAIETIMSDLFGQIVRDVAHRRGIEEKELRAMIDRGPFLAQEALERKLVDKLGYRDQAVARVNERAGKAHANLLYLDRYAERVGDDDSPGAKTVALVYGLGQVARGSSDINPITGSSTMGSDTVAAAFRAAVDDDDVQAIVFRVDSPGGSYVASDAIWRETVRAREAGKPVVVSMGNVAGSGGYFVAMNANKIVAQPGTITGSIGVLGGKPMLRDFWNSLGITWDSVQTSANASMWSSNHGYDGPEWQRFQTWLDHVYEDFTSKVAAGRDMAKEDVLAVAKGRIWSGERAKALGLVDELGGMSRALELAREAAEIAEEEHVVLRVYPRPKPWYLELLGGDAESSEKEAAAKARVVAFHRWRPVLQKLEAWGLWSESTGVLAMPPVPIGP